MGKPKRKKQQQHGRKWRAKKKRRTQRYWIQDCPNLLIPNAPVDLQIHLTVADLYDGHPAAAQETIQHPVVASSRIVEETFPGSHCRQCDNDATTMEQASAIISIQRHPEPPRRPGYSPNNEQQQPYVPLPNGDCGDGIVNPYETTVVPNKYWAQRHRFFDKFDQGIVLDTDGWFSVTPQVIAQHIALRLVRSRPNSKPSAASSLVVLDAFCGVGGNTVALGQHPHVQLVIAVDTNRQRLQYAANNCKVYNVPKHKVLFIHGNAVAIMNRYRDGKLVVNDKSSNKSGKAEDAAVEPPKQYHGYSFGTDECLPKELDAIFLSPPWGGMDYEQIGARHYNLDCITVQSSGSETLNGTDLLQAAVVALPQDKLDVCYFLPRNLNGLELANACWKLGIRGSIEMEQNRINQKLKTISVYVQS